MNVHVVTVDAGRDHIFGRQMAPLLALPGWTSGVQPRRDVDVNFAYPYLQYNPRTFPKAVPTAAFFTHKDLARPEKVAWWEEADRLVNLRTACSDLNLAILRPPALKVTPFVELNHFTPRGRRPKDVVGTSGYIYPEGRKGEALYTRLVVDSALSTVDFTATTPGWGVSARPRGWGAMPDYYRGLTVYVCTSLIEGTGHGPLEALACGVPVVVPTRVGIFDELVGAGVFRYQVGDYEGLVDALSLALELADSIPQDGCRANVERFTVEAWVRSNQDAIATLG